MTKHHETGGHVDDLLAGSLRHPRDMDTRKMRALAARAYSRTGVHQGAPDYVVLLVEFSDQTGEATQLLEPRRLSVCISYQRSTRHDS